MIERRCDQNGLSFLDHERLAVGGVEWVDGRCRNRPPATVPAVRQVLPETPDDGHDDRRDGSEHDGAQQASSVATEPAPQAGRGEALGVVPAAPGDARSECRHGDDPPAVRNHCRVDHESDDEGS